MLFVIPEDMHIAEHTNKNFIKEVAKGLCIRGFVKLDHTHTLTLHSPLKKGCGRQKQVPLYNKKKWLWLLNGIRQS